MKEVTLTLDSGVVKYNDYNSSDLRNSHMKRLVFDIYRNIKYDNDIYTVSFVKPNKDKEFKDVLNEFALVMFEAKNLVFAQAGTLTNEMSSGPVLEGLKIIKEERELLFDSSFVNIIFNRPMYHVCNNADIFILNNDTAKSFISDNIGLDDTHMINRVVNAK